jgi:hypothetical protein
MTIIDGEAASTGSGNKYAGGVDEAQGKQMFQLSVPLCSDV